ncbi:MAG: metallophosphoesterase [Winogradskyella sp.]|uniref:metallophosphoesterase family protein n=1 Tax=Winogradskyella sp. TaxID=1883156 RepID=UPI00385CE802
MNKQIQNIGKLTGKVLLFGGVYSNLQALEALIAIATSEGIPAENCICTGDIIGYCAQPEETLQTFKNWNPKSIIGNVELQLRDNADDCGCDFREGSRCDNFSQQWYPYAKSKLSQDSLNYLQTLPDHIKFTFGGKAIAVVHGSYLGISEFVFKSTHWNIKQPNFDALQSEVIIAGHCGLPFYHENEDQLWLNSGVIGMPANDGNTDVWYAILNDASDTFNFEFRTLSYNHKETHQLMQNGLLPESYAKTIVSGLWDNMEILPETEQKLQGKRIQL